MVEGGVDGKPGMLAGIKSFLLWIGIGLGWIWLAIEFSTWTGWKVASYIGVAIAGAVCGIVFEHLRFGRAAAAQLRAATGQVAALQQQLVGSKDAWLKTQANALAHELHYRWFGDGHLDDDYRVSLFMLMDPSTDAAAWTCVGRTIKPADEAARWPRPKTGEAAERHGLIVWAYARGAADAEVPGVEEAHRRDPAHKARYLHATKIGDEEHSRRSWPFASMRVVFPRKRGEVPFVVVIERKCGKKIEPIVESKKFNDELQLAADLWCGQ